MSNPYYSRCPHCANIVELYEIPNAEHTANFTMTCDYCKYVATVLSNGYVLKLRVPDYDMENYELKRSAPKINMMPIYQEQRIRQFQRPNIKQKIIGLYMKMLRKKDRDAVNEFYAHRPEGHEVDHVIPLSRGGSHHLSNLQYLPTHLNNLKRNKLPEELPAGFYNIPKPDKRIEEIDVGPTRFKGIWD